MSRKGAVIWLAGPPGVGKTTLARGILVRLHAHNRATLWLDSDDLRPHLTPDPQYTEAERAHFYGVVGHLAKLAEAGGTTAVISATASRQHYRDAVRTDVDMFFEVSLAADPAELRRRDPKGLYALADAGEITTLPGVGADFEPGDKAEVAVRTDENDEAQVLELVWDALCLKLDGLG